MLTGRIWNDHQLNTPKTGTGSKLKIWPWLNRGIPHLTHYVLALYIFYLAFIFDFPPSQLMVIENLLLSFYRSCYEWGSCVGRTNQIRLISSTIWMLSLSWIQHPSTRQRLHWFVNTDIGINNPESTRRRFDVDTTLFGRQQRCYNVETTSCDYWEFISSFDSLILRILVMCYLRIAISELYTGILFIFHWDTNSLSGLLSGGWF